tara:strand:+ start:11654 stop:12460 length:807 start_codon:yes stop_codon:yes gene_type:complete
MPLNFNVIYVFGEPGRSDIIKIGTCSKGGWERFREGAFMNPRGLEVFAMWQMPDTATTRLQERNAHKLFRRLEGADGKEWFISDRDQAVARLTLLFGKEPDFRNENLPFSVEALYTSDRYDELSERGDRYKGRLVQRRIWIHSERGGEFTKISQNTWWCEPASRSTNSKRITYNTRRMNPVACLAIAIDETCHDWGAQVEASNAKTMSVYQHLVEEFAVRNLPSGRVGWTRTAPDRLIEELVELDFTNMDLDPNRPPRGVKSVTYPGR